MATVVAANASKWELSALWVPNVELVFEVKRINREIDDFRQLCAEVARLRRGVKKMNISLTNTAKVRN